MITKLSAIFTFSLTILAVILTGILSSNWLLAILIGLGVFVLTLGSFCAYILITLPIFGKKFASVYDPKEKKRWEYMNDISHFIIFWLNFKLHVKGLDKLKGLDTVVFYSNHQGFADMFIYDIVFKDFPRGSMYKIEHASNPIIAGMVDALGGVAVDRSNDRSAVKSVLEIIKRVKSGVNFMIYPEGTRARGKGLNEYHPGSFKVAQKSGAPLVIVAIDGADKLSTFVPFIPTHIYIEVVDVLDSEYNNSMSSIDLSNDVRNRTINALEAARSANWYLKERKRNENG